MYVYIRRSGCSGSGWSELTFSSPELTHEVASEGPVSPGHLPLASVSTGDHRQEIEQLRRQLETYQQRDRQRDQYRDQQREQYRDQYDWGPRQYRDEARPASSVREASLIVHERVVIVTPRVLITQGEAAETPQHQTPLPSHSEARDLVRLANCLTPLDSHRALTPLDAQGAVSPLDTHSAVSPLSTASLPASPAPLPQEDTPQPSHQEARQLAIECGNIGHTFTIKLAANPLFVYLLCFCLFLILCVVRNTVCMDVVKV